MSELNPEIQEFTVGARTIKKVKIYPLSFADQRKATELIKAVFAELEQGAFDVKYGTPDVAEDASAKDKEKAATQAAEAKSKAEIAVVEKGVEFIRKHIQKFADLVTDEDNRIEVDELTNNQLSGLVVMIYDMNFDGMVKNFQGLFEKVKKILPANILAKVKM